MTDSHPVLFLTGSMRSGTTLLSEIVDSLAATRCFNQPLPSLFVRLKQLFNASVGLNNDSIAAYPLTDLFAENHYPVEMLADFLERHFLDKSQLRDVAAKLSAYPGAQTPVSEAVLLDAWRPGIRLAEYADAVLRSLSGDDCLAVHGLKEVVCEEFTDYFLRSGNRAIIIIRHIVDVINSHYGPLSPVYTGKRRPLLYVVRQWRKSVAYCIRNAPLSGFAMLKYEDIVSGGSSVVADALTGACGTQTSTNDSEVAQFSCNSSFSGSERRDVTPPRLKQLAEALCVPELRALQYPTSIGIEEAKDVIARTQPFEEPSRLPEYEWNTMQAQRELSRLRAIESGHSPEGVFLDGDVFESLRSHF